MDLTWLLELIKSILFFVDGIIYSFILTVYNLLNDIANTTLFNDGISDGVKDKVFALVGVFMLFKVSFSLLTYVVNPDSFADKTKGFSKLITNIIITLVLLVSIKFIFNQAMEIQSIILKDGTLQKIFSSENYSYSSIDAGNTMALETFKAFYHPNTDNCSSNNPDDCVAIAFGDDGTSLNAYNTAKTANSFTLYKNAVGVNAKNSDGDYIMTYTPIISTVCGVVILLLLITFCFDVALRSVKLGFLEMLAPIPIIARIEPKGSKMFDKWVGECISTYLTLFIRLLAIYFAVFIIQQLPNLTMVNAVTGSEEGIGLFTKVFIVMGALMFAKQLPKLISDITGSKLDGKFTLNPLKKMSEVPVVGRPMAATTQFTGRTAKNILGAVGHVAKDNLISPTANKVSNSNFGRKVTDSMEKLKTNATNKYQRANMITGGRISDIASDFNSTVGAIGRSIEDDLGLYENRDRILSNREAEILARQSQDKEIMQKNKTMSSSNDAVMDRAKKKVAESVQYAKRKAEVRRLQADAESYSGNTKELESKRDELQRNLNNYTADYNASTDNVKRAELASKMKTASSKLTELNSEIAKKEAQSKMAYYKYAEAEANFNKWANKDGLYEFIDSYGDFEGRAEDAVLNGLINKRDETAKALSDDNHDYVSQFVGVSAKDSDDSAGILKGENTSIESKFVKYEQELYEIKEQKRQLQEERRSVGDYRKIGKPNNK